MQIEKISRSLDWLHARLPKFSRRLFISACVLVALAVMHTVAAAMIESYTLHVLAQYDRAAAEQSVLALPLGHFVGMLAAVSVWLCVPVFLLRALLGLRARLWRKVKVSA